MLNIQWLAEFRLPETYLDVTLNFQQPVDSVGVCCNWYLHKLLPVALRV
jgi:hypothetical protein